MASADSLSSKFDDEAIDGMHRGVACMRTACQEGNVHATQTVEPTGFPSSDQAGVCRRKDFDFSVGMSLAAAPLVGGGIR